MKVLLVAYDNGSYINWFPQGLAYIAAVCRQAGHQVTIYNQDIYHWPEQHLTEKLNREHYDVIGVGACGGYYQYRRILKIADAVNRSTQRPFFLMGGHIASPEPGFFLRKTGADAIVVGEGEQTTLELLAALEAKRSLSEVAGIAYLDGDSCVQTAPRKLISDIDTIPFPAWDLFPMEHYTLLRMPHVQPTDRTLPVLSGRGCPFHCNFCYRMVDGFRPRSTEAIVAEIQQLQRDYAVNYIAFSDELLMSSVKRTTELCEGFIRAKLNVHWDCNGRLNYAKPEVLRLMREAGCVFVNYGIESLDEAALRRMKKSLTVQQITQGIENTLAAGISPGYNIIWGNLGETKESLRLGVEFLLKYDDHSQMRTIRPVTPYPGSPLYYHAIEHGMLKDCEDFYEHKHLNSDLVAVNFTDLSDQEFHQALYEANTRLMQHYHDAQLKGWFDAARKLYLEGDTSFRGFRRS